MFIRDIVPFSHPITELYPATQQRPMYQNAEQNNFKYTAPRYDSAMFERTKSITRQIQYPAEYGKPKHCFERQR